MDANDDFCVEQKFYIDRVSELLRSDNLDITKDLNKLLEYMTKIDFYNKLNKVKIDSYNKQLSALLKQTEAIDKINETVKNFYTDVEIIRGRK